MTKPQSSSVGGEAAAPMIISLLGKDTASKVELFGLLNTWFNRQYKSVKMLYLPLYNQIDSQNSSQELLLGAMLAKTYLQEGHNCLTNLDLEEADISYRLSTKTAAAQALGDILKLVQDKRQLKQSQVVKTKQIKVSVLASLDSGLPIFPDLQQPSFYQPKEFSGNYQQLISQVNKRLLERLHSLADKLPDSDSIFGCLPLSLIGQVELEPEDILISEISGKTSSLQYLNNFAEELQLPSRPAEDLKLLSFTPRLEMDSVADLLYGFTDLDRDSIMSDLEDKSYEDKYQLLVKYLRQPDLEGHLNNVSYSFEITSDTPTYLDISNSGLASNIKRQIVTPRLGYDIPRDIEQAGLAEEYESCFDDAIALVSKLETEYGSSLAQYQCLFGHRFRWSFTIGLEDLLELKQHLKKSTYNQLKSAISEAHPMISSLL